MAAGPRERKASRLTRRSEERKGLVIKPLEVAWLAGLVEGEGCLSIKKEKKSTRACNTIHLHIGMCDRDIIARAGELLGCKVLGPYKHPGDDGFKRKVQWRVVATGGLAAAWMMTLYPFFGERRKQAVRDCLAFWRDLPINGRMQLPLRLGHRLHGLRYASYDSSKSLLVN